MNNINVIENATVVVEDGIIKEIGSLEDILKNIMKNTLK